MQLTDKIIRAALVAKLSAEDPNAVILHELPLSRGERRADVAHVNGILAGFEIKSSVDSLARMSGQASAYGEVFEQMTAVIARCHLRSLRVHIPNTWGILVAQESDQGLAFRQVRKSRKNNKQLNSKLVGLLWKEECSRILRAQGIKLPRTALVIEMWELLDQMPTKFLCSEVKAALKARYSRQQRQL
jgi:hypothetical protein